MPFRSLDLLCPSCRPRTQLAPEGEGARCAKCRGWFLEERILLERLGRARPDRPAPDLLEHNDGTPRRPCPACNVTMNIVWLEFLQLDRCDEHGVWLDPGELERALAWDVVPDDLPRPRDDRTKQQRAADQANLQIYYDHLT